jgi:hypothetical protein
MAMEWASQGEDGIYITNAIGQKVLNTSKKGWGQSNLRCSHSILKVCYQKVWHSHPNCSLCGQSGHARHGVYKFNVETDQKHFDTYDT